jgi:hypothetical protein
MAGPKFKVKYDVSDVETEFHHVEPGMYICKVETINYREDTKSGNGPNLEVILKPVKDSKGKKVKLKDKKGKPVTPANVYTYVMLEHEPSEWKLAEFIRAFGLKEGGELTDKIVAKLVGKDVQANLKSDTDQDGNYRPRIAKLLALPDEEPDDDDDDDDDDDEPDTDADDTDEDEDDDSSDDDDDDDDEEDEDEDEDDDSSDEDEDEDDDDEESSDEPNRDNYDKDELDALDNDDLVDVAFGYEEEDEQYDGWLDEDDKSNFVKKGKLSDKGRKKLIAAVLAAQEEPAGDDDDDEDESEGEAEEKPDYDSMSVADLKKLAKERGLEQKGTKAKLAARLKKDDEDDQPF